MAVGYRLVNKAVRVEVCARLLLEMYVRPPTGVRATQHRSAVTQHECTDTQRDARATQREHTVTQRKRVVIQSIIYLLLAKNNHPSK